MKNATVLLATLLVSSNIFSQTINKQNTYLDALELISIEDSINKHKKTDDISELIIAFNDILKRYELGFDNPFLQYKELTVANSCCATDTTQKNVAIYNGFSVQKPDDIKSNGNWQTAVLNGVASFMAGRFKQEVLNMGINTIFKAIKDNEKTDLVKDLFPKTFKEISRLYNNGQNSYYTADLLMLRQLAIADYEALPQTLIAKADIIFPKLANEPKVKDLFTLGSSIYQLSNQGTDLPSLISQLCLENYNNATMKDIVNYSDFLSQALLNAKGQKTIWKNPIELLPRSISDLEKNKELKYFYGLLYEQIKHEPKMNQLITNIGNDKKKIADELFKLVSIANQLNSTYNYLKSIDFSFTKPEQYGRYLSLIQECIATVGINKEIQKALNIKEEIISRSNDIISVLTAVNKKDYQQVVPLIITAMGDYMNLKNSRTLLFVSQLALINNADDMERLLNAYSLPIGSSSIKRKSSQNFSVNSYVGLTVGNEIAYGQSAQQSKTNIGLTAPIGITYTFSVAKTKKGRETVSLFASILDIGSMVNARLNNDTTSYTGLKLEHFLSPGLGVYYNFKKIPVTTGLHYSYIPNLRTIQYEKGQAIVTETNRSVSRFNFSVLVDIPFFTLFNKD